VVKERAIKYFEFRQYASVLKSTGRKATTLQELRDIIAHVSDESIFHHMYQYFLKGHVLQYTNDFAHWAGESLEERVLSEHLSNIDPYGFRKIGDLRQELLRVIDEYMTKFPSPRQAMPGDEFCFNQTITLVFPVGMRVQNLAEFLLAIKYADPGCIYYHFYEARTRLGSGIDDFSAWIAGSLDNKDLARQINAIDPFMHMIEGIREHIIEVVEQDLRQHMEVLS